VPIYEYVCKDCNHAFEALVRRTETPVCEACGSGGLERVMSMPYVKSETTKDKSLRAAKARDKKLGTERTQAQLAYERSHND
jgi:putative FmdB family regulatory protein